ncbi:E3 ubiquitin-protein ligase UBR2-like isoform X3 [Convolutriloba macropyga]|uniref:E3 ubiquitin-protein ligase UBR2-like isoform X3 n=1 Tax=Convolutriloba macropyga TaxID=536237 RepID=UPI003F51FAC5
MESEAKLTAGQLEQAFLSKKGLRGFFNSYCCEFLTSQFAYPLDTLDADSGDTRFRELILDPLEAFIFGDTSLDDFVSSFERENQQRPTKCGRIFTNGEPHYSCRECSMDPTCVLCRECFQASEHKTHKYRIGTSGGGGCCDCGDEEAWKKDPYCDLHRPSENTQEGEELRALPERVEKRVRAVFEIVIAQFIHYLSIHTSEFEEENVRRDSSVYCTVLYNDELHTFEQVIEALKRALLCDNATAKFYATAVDREGRHLVFKRSKAECDKVKKKIDEGITKASVALSRRKPIHILVMREVLFIMQGIVQRLLRWLIQAAIKLGQFRRMFCDLLLEPMTGGMTLLEVTLLNDTKLWKSVRSDWHGLLIKTFLIDYDHKRQFAIYFMKHYSQIIEDYANDEHHHNFSVSSMTVQIFTVPSIARYLVFQCGALRTTLATFIEAFTTPKGSVPSVIIKRALSSFVHAQSGANSPSSSSALSVVPGSVSPIQIQNATGGNTVVISCGKLKLSNMKYVSWDVVDIARDDVEYLLQFGPDTWDEEQRNVFLSAFTLLAEFLSAMENLVSVKREVKHHIEVEPEWEPAMRLQITLDRILSRITQIASTDAILLERSIATVAAIMARERSSKVLLEEKVLFGIQTNCIVNPVESHSISIHLQLNRMLAALASNACHVFPKVCFDWSTKLRNLLGSVTTTRLMEPCLRVVVLAAQVLYANMWKRNGFSLLNQVHLYHRVSGRVHMYNQDIAMLQLCACMCSSMNDFLINVLNKFHSKLLDWFETRQEARKSLEDSSKTYLTLIEEFLYLIIVILSERHLVLAQSSDLNANIQYELLHLLLLGICSHSEIVKKVTLTEEIQEIDENLHVIASFSVQKKKFEPKEEAVAGMFNPMCYHLSKAELATIEEKMLKERKDAKLPEYISPPTLQPMKPELRGILCIFDSDVFFFILHSLLRQALLMSDRFYSENIVHYSVYLIAMGLNEEADQIKRDFDPNDKGPQLDFAQKCFGFTGSSGRDQPNSAGDNIGFYLQELLKTDGRVDNYKPLIQHVIEKQRAVCAMRAKMNESEATVSPMDCDQPLSTVSANSSGVENSAEKNRKRQRELARKTRELAMAQMKSAQVAFKMMHSEQLDEIATADPKEQLEEYKSNTSIVLLGSGCSELSLPKPMTEACLVCKSEELQEDPSPRSPSTSGTHDSPNNLLSKKLRDDKSTVDSSSTAEESTDNFMAQIVFIQKTTIFSQSNDPSIKLPTGDELDKYDPVPHMATCPWGSLVSSCGHHLHIGCWQKYFNNLVAEEQSRQGIRRLAGGKAIGYILEKGEFLCPMCGALGNALVPTVQPNIFEPYTRISSVHSEQPTSPNDVQYYFNLLHEFSNYGGTRSDTMSDTSLFEKMVGRGIQKAPPFPQNVAKILENCAEQVYIKGLEVNPDSNNPRIPVVLWNSIATTVLVQEYCCRFSQKPLFAQSMKQKYLDSLCRNMMLIPKLNVHYLDACKKHLINLFQKIFLNFRASAFLYEYDLFYYMVYIASSLHLMTVNHPDDVMLPACNMFMRQIIYKFILIHFINLHVAQVLLKMAQDIASKDDQPMAVDDVLTK